MLNSRRVWPTALFIFLLGSFSGAASAQGARPVIDLDPGVYAEGSFPRGFVSVGDRTFFTAKRFGEGRELWITDGSSAGTRLVSDIAPGVSDVRVEAATALNGGLVFVADNGGHGAELWWSDGTARGTQRLTDIAPGPDSGVPTQALSVLDGFAYFVARNSAGIGALWRSSGADGVTESVLELNPSDPLYTLGQVAVSGGRVFFVEGHLFKDGGAIYASDGTPGSVVRLLDGVIVRTRFLEFRGATWFSAIRAGKAGLWFTDGSAPGTRVLRGAPAALQSARLGLVAAHENFLYFTVNGGQANGALWRTDGTGAGTMPVADAFPDVTAISVLNTASTFGGTYLLLGSLTESALWFVRARDGRFIRIEQPDDLWLDAPTMVSVGESLYFVASQTGVNNVWQVPGNAQQMRRVTDFESRFGSGVSAGGTRTVLHDAGGYLLFSAEDDRSGQELWRSEFSPGTAQLLRDIQPDRGADGGVERLAALDDQVVFAGPGRLGGTGVWRSGGSAADTERFLDFPLYPDCYAPGVKRRPRVGGFRRIQSRLAFWVSFTTICPAGRSETWVTDGTQAGSSVIAPVGLSNAQALGDRLVGIGGNPAEIWVTDGTKLGSRPLTNLNLGVSGSLIELSAPFHGQIYFLEDDFLGEARIWRTDGTLSGTYPLVSVDPALTAAGGIVRALGQTPEAVFWMLERNSEFEVWRISPDQRVSRVAALGRSPGQYFEFTRGTALGHRLVFAFHGDDGLEPWVTDGTAPGTRQIADIGPGAQGADGEAPFGFGAFQGRLVFGANDGVHGRELWWTDGTPQGTYMARDLLPGPLGSLRWIARIDDDTLYLSARTAGTGEELWGFDGRRFTQLTEILPGSQGVDISSLVDTGDATYFTVDDGVIGRELWVLDRALPLTVPGVGQVP